MPIVCQECGELVGGASIPVQVRIRTRASWSELTAPELGAWCSPCERITVFEVVDA